MREPAIDAAKAIGILLVVLGHSPGIGREAVVLIYSFHMPLFFFLSGTLHPAMPSQPGRLRRKAAALLIPYVFFFALSLAYWLATRGIGERARKFAGVGIEDALRGFFTGLSEDLFVNPALWFLPCLFVCVLLFELLRRRLSAAAIVMLALAVAGLWQWATHWQPRLPWSLDIGWVALAFYAAGAALRGWPHAFRRRTALTLLPLVSIAWLLAALQLGRVDFAHANFGDAPLLYLATASLGIAIVVLASPLLPGRNAVLRWLSDNTLVIFALQGLLLNFASGVLKLLRLDDGNWAALFFVWSLLASVPVAELLTRRLPFLLGRSGLRAPSAAVRGLS